MLTAYIWGCALLGGSGIFLAVRALLGPPATRPGAIPPGDRFAGGQGQLARLAYRLAPQSPRQAERVTQWLKQANWYWAPGESAPPAAQAPFTSVRGFYARATYLALVGGGLGLLAGLLVVLLAELPVWVALVPAALAAYTGYIEPQDRVRNAAAARQKALLKEMAFRLPELSATVTAGKSIMHALRELTARPGGPLVTEVARLLQIFDLTRSLEPAVQQVIAHNRYRLLTEFLHQVLFVEQRGGAIGPALQVMAAAAQEQLRRQLVAQGLSNRQQMGLPIVAGAFIVTMLLLMAPILVAILQML